MFDAETPEKEVIARAKNGDGNAYETLYRRHKAKVHLLCLRMTGNVADAEDISQEVFLRLFLKLDSFRGEAKLLTWLHRITVNCVLMHLRRCPARRSPPAVQLTETLPLDSVLVVRNRVMLSAVNRVALERAVNDLPQGRRSVFVLHDINGLTHTETAHLLNVSVACSRSRLHEAHLQLRDVLFPPPPCGSDLVSLNNRVTA